MPGGYLVTTVKEKHTRRKKVLTDQADFRRFQLPCSLRSERSKSLILKAFSEESSLVKSRKESWAFSGMECCREELILEEEDDERGVNFRNEFFSCINCISNSFEYQEFCSVKSKRYRDMSLCGGTLEIGKPEKVPTCVTYSHD